MSSFIELCREELELLKERTLHLEGYLAACDESDEAAPRRKASAQKPKADHPWRGKKAPRKCGECGQAGHTARTCPKRKGAAADEADDDDKGEDAKDDADEKDEPKEVTREQVQALKDEGLTSLSVAARLGVRLSEVNKHW